MSTYIRWTCHRISTCCLISMMFWEFEEQEANNIHSKPVIKFYNFISFYLSFSWTKRSSNFPMLIYIYIYMFLTWEWAGKYISMSGIYSIIYIMQLRQNLIQVENMWMLALFLVQLISNDNFKSAVHRVLANQVGPRISVACFFSTHLQPVNQLYGPITELLSDDNPPLYRETLVREYALSYALKLERAWQRCTCSLQTLNFGWKKTKVGR